MTKKVQDLADGAATVLVGARQVLEQWHSRAGEARGELVELEGLTGEELLADPERAAALPARMRELRDQVEVITRTAAAQEQRVRAAERDWLAAQAVLVEVTEVMPARKALRAHQDRTRELLAALEEHDGPYVPQHRLASAQRVAGVVFEGAVEWRVPTSQVLEVALARAEVRHRVVAAMAKGEDPAILVVGRQFVHEITETEAYPEAVRPGGLVLAPAYAAHAGRARAVVAELEQLPAVLGREIAEWEDRAIRGDAPDDVVRAAVERRRVRIEEIPAELDAAREQLASMTGA